MEIWYRCNPANFMVKLATLRFTFILPSSIADSEYIRELVYTYIPPSSFSKKPERERKKFLSLYKCLKSTLFLLFHKQMAVNIFLIIFYFFVKNNLKIISKLFFMVRKIILILSLIEIPNVHTYFKRYCRTWILMPHTL